MERTMKKLGVAAAASVAIAFALTPALTQAGGRIFETDDTKWMSAGLGIRVMAVSASDKAPSGNDYSQNFLLEDIRPYFNGQVHKNIKFEFNIDYGTGGTSGVGDLQVLDAIAKFEFSEMFNIWAGRHLVPSDRANLSGPYYQNAWGFPTLAHQYYAKFAGRDDGVTVFGQVGGGKFKWAAGVAQGRKGDFNQLDNMRYVGRLTFNVFDPEPGYYNSSTYYGGKDMVLAIGLVGQTQKDGAGTGTGVPPLGTSGDSNAWNVDALFERNLGADLGTVTLEGGYYGYDTQDGMDGKNGEAWVALVSYLLPVMGLQPSVRMQRFNYMGMDVNDEQLDVALAHIIDGHNAKIVFTWTTWDTIMMGTSTGKTDAATLGAQFQF